MERIRVLLITTSLLAAISVVVSFFISTEATSDDASAFHSLFAISIAVAVLHTGAAVGFLAGLRNFKAGLKLAYRLMCVGFVFLGLTFFQTPVLSLYDLWDSPWVEFGGVILPLLIAAICLYLGARSFARLLGIKHIATSFWLATLAAGLIVGIVLIAPHPYTGVEEQQARAGAAFSGILTAYLTFATWAVYLTQQRVGTHLKAATKWLCIVLGIAAVAGLQHTVLGLALSHEHWYQSYGVSILIHVVDGILLLKAAYLFNKSSEDDTTTSDVAKGPDSPIEIVTYVASLASAPSDIDPILEDFRFITANLQGQTTPDAATQQKLAGVYTKLEHYLVTDERLRKFTDEDIRKKVTEHFTRSPDNETFWLETKL